MLFVSRAAITGSEPPTRSSSGRAPNARSNASRPSWIAFSSGRTSAAGAIARRSTSTSAPSGAASSRSFSIAAEISSPSWPGASRIDTFASATTGSTVFCSSAEPPLRPWTSTAGSSQVRL